MDRSVPKTTHGNASSASLPQPIDIATVYSPSSTSRTSGRSAPRARLHSTPPPPPSLEDQASLRSSQWDPCQSSAGATLYAYIHLSFVPAATCKYHPQVGTHADSSTATSASTALAGTHHAIGADPRARRVTFSKASRPGTLHGQIWPYQT